MFNVHLLFSFVSFFWELIQKSVQDLKLNKTITGYCEMHFKCLNICD